MTGCELYLISPLDVGGDFPDRLRAALEAGPVAAFQFRVKDVDQHEAARLAAPLLEICREHDCAFIVNDSVPLAKRLGADGVHLGQGDGDPREAREELGKDAQIGVTCHNSRHLALEAGEMGADYVAFGAFFPSDTKEAKVQAEPEILEWWSSMMEPPVSPLAGSRWTTPRRSSPREPISSRYQAGCGTIPRGRDQPCDSSLRSWPRAGTLPAETSSRVR